MRLRFESLPFLGLFFFLNPRPASCHSNREDTGSVNFPLKNNVTWGCFVKFLRTRSVCKFIQLWLNKEEFQIRSCQRHHFLMIWKRQKMWEIRKWRKIILMSRNEKTDLILCVIDPVLTFDFLWVDFDSSEVGQCCFGNDLDSLKVGHALILES